MSSLDFSKVMVDEYIAYYDSFAGRGQSQAVTLSVVDVSRVGQLVLTLTSMTNTVVNDMTGYAQTISDARGRSNLPWSENG